MRQQMEMIQAPIALVTRREFLIMRHNDVLAAKTKNEIELQVTEIELEEHIANKLEDTEWQTAARGHIDELTRVIHTQQIQLKVIESGLDEEPAEEKEKN